MPADSFTIHDVFEIAGGVVVALADPKLDTLSREEFESLLVGAVVINAHSGQLEAKASKMEFSTSLIDKKNVFLLLEGCPANEVRAGSELVRRPDS